MRMHNCTIFGPKMAHLPKWEFFQKTWQWALFFFHSCLSTCQKSKSYINLLVKYSYGWLTFHRMLINHKNFHFTQASDKTNDVTFFKSPKTMNLGHFWPSLVIFAPWRFFPKNPALSHTTIYGPVTPC